MGVVYVHIYCKVTWLLLGDAAEVINVVFPRVVVCCGRPALHTVWRYDYESGKATIDNHIIRFSRMIFMSIRPCFKLSYISDHLHLEEPSS